LWWTGLILKKLGDPRPEERAMTQESQPQPPTHTVKSLAERLGQSFGQLGFTHERKALALAVLGLFSSYFALLMLIARNDMPEWFPAFSAMFALYFITFFAVAAHWFWGRWVAIGIGSWGATIAAWGVVTTRELSPPLVILGVSHGLIALLLMGNSMAAHYEDRADWRLRFGLDDEGVKRLRRTVTRAASSIPAIVLFALAPREDGAALVALAAIGGLGVLLLGRTIGLAGLLLAGGGALGLVAFAPAPTLDAHGLLVLPIGPVPQVLGVYAALALFAAVGPFVGPIGRFLKR
jgi:hypothetical protein